MSIFTRYNRSAMNRVVRSRDDSGETLALAAGDLLELRLPETPTTGYLWKPVGLDTAILKLQSSRFVSQGTVPGRGGTRILEFLAAGPGDTVLRLKLFRGWSGESSAVDQFELTVTVTRA